MDERTIVLIIVGVILAATVILSMRRYAKRRAAETERWLREEGC